MGQGPWEAHQDGDELRAGVESLTSGPAGQGRASGPHLYGWEEGRGLLCTAVLRMVPGKSREPRSLDYGKELVFLHHMCGSKGYCGSRLCSAPHHGSGSSLQRLSSQFCMPCPYHGFLAKAGLEFQRTTVEKGRGRGRCQSEMPERVPTVPGTAGSFRKGAHGPHISQC